MKVFGFLLVCFSSFLLVSPAHGALVADYQFNNDLTSDVVGAGDLVDLGAGTYQTTQVNGRQDTVLGFTAGTGLRFDTSGLLANNEFTIVMWVAIDDNGSYVKLADFNNLVIDEGLYNYDGTLIVYDQADGTDVVINNGQFHQIVMTRSAGDEINGYVDGALQISFTDNGENIISADNFIHFFRDDDDTSNSENSSGQVARIMVFDEALAADDLGGLGLAPPVMVPTLSQYMLLFLALMIGIMGLFRAGIKQH